MASFVNREAPHEPDEKPTELGRHIWTVAQEHPGEWRVVYESENRQRAVHIEGCLIGRGAGRIAPILDLTGWDARMVEVASSDGASPLYEIRVRYTPPKGVAKTGDPMEDLRRGHQVADTATARVAEEHPETNRVSGNKVVQEQLGDRR